jgi:hypothetical protein
MGSLVWPFIAAAVLQLGYVILFPTVLGQFETRRHTTQSDQSAVDGR